MERKWLKLSDDENESPSTNNKGSKKFLKIK